MQNENRSTYQADRLTEDAVFLQIEPTNDTLYKRSSFFIKGQTFYCLKFNILVSTKIVMSRLTECVFV